MNLAYHLILLTITLTRTWLQAFTLRFSLLACFNSLNHLHNELREGKGSSTMTVLASARFTNPKPCHSSRGQLLLSRNHFKAAKRGAISQK